MYSENVFDMFFEAWCKIFEAKEPITFLINGKRIIVLEDIEYRLSDHNRPKPKHYNQFRKEYAMKLIKKLDIINTSVQRGEPDE